MLENGSAANNQRHGTLPITAFPSVLNELDICFSLHIEMGSNDTIVNCICWYTWVTN